MNNNTETKAGIFDCYEISRGGLIKNPGKFEGQPWQAVLVYEWYLNGDFGEELGDPEILQQHLYRLAPSDKALLECHDDVAAVELTLTDSGFVYLSFILSDALARFDKLLNH